MNTTIICDIVSCDRRTDKGTCNQATIRLQGCAAEADNVIACSQFYEQPEPEVVVVPVEIVKKAIKGLSELLDNNGFSD